MFGCCGRQCTVCTLAWSLIFIGAFNWGLIGLGGFLGQNLNIVNLLLGTWPTVEWLVYILVGVAALAKALKLCKCDKMCDCGTKGGMKR